MLAQLLQGDATTGTPRSPGACRRTCRAIGGLWALLLLLVAMLGAVTVARAAAITTVEVRAEADATVVTLTFDGPFQVPAAFYMADPPRMVLDFADIRTPAPQAHAGAGAVRGARQAQFRPDVTRLVLDLAEPVLPVAVSGDSPITGSAYALTLRLRPTAARAFSQAAAKGRQTLVPGNATAAAALAPSSPATAPTAVAPGVASKPTDAAVSRPAAARPEPVRSSPARPARLPVVVIDAGHGGQDPGAPSVIPGRYEKEVTLAIAKAIKAELDSSGKFKAVLTRSTDVFIPLGGRVAIARQAGADLFISIHADSIGRPDVRGATVYTLSETASDKEAERLAAKENKADIIAGINLGAESADVTNILIDLVQRETKNYSAEFAGIVVREVSNYMHFRSNHHRFAGFVVLKAPDVPSVLFETGYMSNLEDSQYLFSPEGQAAIAKGVRRAVEAYFQRRFATLASP